MTLKYSNVDIDNLTGKIYKKTPFNQLRNNKKYDSD